MEKGMYPKDKVYDHVFRCDECGEARDWGNSKDSDSPQVRDALIQCARCGRNSRHVFVQATRRLPAAA